MNKKIFTLLASSLMLFLTALVVNAQVPGFYGSDVPFLPSGKGKGAYHLKVSSFGDNISEPAGGWGTNATVLLALDKDGYLKLINYDDYLVGDDSYQNLREALWCVDVKKPEKLGQQPAYNFINKAYETLLSVDTGFFNGTDFGPTAYAGSAAVPADLMLAQTKGTLSDVFVGGQFGNWAFSHEYENYLITDQPLFIEIPNEPDYFMTFAFDDSFSPWRIRLVKVHAEDLKGGDFYDDYLVRFTLVNASPRVLTAEDFNTTLWTKPTGTSSTMFFDPDTKGQPNVLAQALTAVESARNVGASYKDYYMTFQKPTSNNRGAYIYVADGDDEDNYYNDNNLLYPKLLEVSYANATPDEQYDFRLVYYPSEDSLVINVRGFTHILPTYGNNTPLDGYAFDTENYDRGDDDLFTREIWDFLIVRMQDLTTTLNERVITVSNRPANTRVHFGIKDCEVRDNRTTVPRDLYLIRDQLGRYLVMPLELGDFTPQWIEPRNNEDPMKTPSYHWLVYPMNENATVSAVVLVNREFDWVQIEFSTVYSEAELFNGTFGILAPTASATAYNNVFGINSGAKIYYKNTVTHEPYKNDPVLNPGNKDNRKWNVIEGWHGSFLKVQDDKDVAAKATANPKIALTQGEMQLQHRTNPYLGYKYIAEDTLNYFTYSFNHLHKYGDNFYLGPIPGQSSDTILYGYPEPNHFRLELPDSRKDKHSTEKYGIGWKFDLKAHASTKDIAPLERYYYHFMEQSYWDFNFYRNFVVLGENRRYGFMPEATANATMQKAAFYIRFTYQPPAAPEYYTLLHRIPESKLDYYTNVMNIDVGQLLKAYDVTHNGTDPDGLKTDSLGILALAIDDNTAYARAYPKVLRDLVSTFAVSNDYEPLYRRFNEGLYYPTDLDANVDDGGVKGSDEPRLVKIYRAWNDAHTDYLYEDANSVNAREHYKWTEPGDSKGINYLSLENIYDHNVWMDQNVGHYPHNFSFYLDTAYVNRGTGHIKPQYLIMVGPQFINEQGCSLCNEPLNLRKGIYGRYLINAWDSAYSSNYPAKTLRANGDDYLWDQKWERLVFVPAIHIGDSLYILKGGQTYESLRSYTPLIIREDQYGVEYLHLESLKAAAANAKNLIDIHPLGDNYHKDYVFSMRFYKRGDYEHFLLESETEERSKTTGLMIAPMQGGWVKWQNNEMVITRGSYSDAIRDGEKWNTEPTTDAPVANDNVAATAVKVIAGEGNITILNAAGKRVTISNVLGQTVAGAVLTSDNAAIAAPKGVLVVAVEGENAVKAVVK